MLKWFKRDKSKSKAETPGDNKAQEQSQAADTGKEFELSDYNPDDYDEYSEDEESLEYNYADMEEYESAGGFEPIEDLEPDLDDEIIDEPLEESAIEEPPYETPSEPPGEPIAQPEPAAESPQEKKKGFMARLKDRLSGTRAVLNTRVDHLLLGVKQIDDDIIEELEEILITSDLGMTTTQALIKTISQKVARKELDSPEHLKKTLRQSIAEFLKVPPADLPNGQKPHVMMVIGVNGVGKTTTIAKLARRHVEAGQKVMIVAADTFRAAAVEQLSIWAERVGADIVKQQTGADPSAVVFDALNAAQARGHDLVIIDTAGRLHTKVNLMEELKKIHRIADREMPGAPHEVLLVLDATTGQNAVSQAKLFNEAVPVNHLAMTKLDGTAKGGVLVAISHDLKIPVRYIGIGEGMDDLRDFDPDVFVEALFGE